MGYLRLLIFLALISLCYFEVSALESQVVSDSKSSLTIAVSFSELKIGGGAHGLTLDCDGCQKSTVAGSPQIPFYVFSVISTLEQPSVSIVVENSTLQNLPGDISPVPHYASLYDPKYEKVSNLYAASLIKKARVSDIRFIKGVPVRTIAIPLVLLKKNSKAVEVLNNLRVVVAFPEVNPHPGKFSFPDIVKNMVLNPVGGRYLYAPPSERLSKRSVSALSGDFHFPMIKIKIGDENIVPNSTTQGVYEISFGFLQEVFSSLSLTGVNINNIRMYTGSQDTLPVSLASHPVSSGSLREIPVEIVDNGSLETFDENDKIRFYGHSSSYWKCLSDSQPAYPIHYSFHSNTYSYYNYYYLEFSSPNTGSAPALRLNSVNNQQSSSTIQTSSWHYLRAEQDLNIASCGLTNYLDFESGKLWLWYLMDTAKAICSNSNNIQLTLRNQDLATPDIRALANYKPGDKVYLGMFTKPFSNGDSISVIINGNELPRIPVVADEGYYFEYGGQIEPGSFQLDQVSLVGKGYQSHAGDPKTVRGFDGYTVIYNREIKYSLSAFTIFPEYFDRSVSYRIANTLTDPSKLRILKTVNGIAEVSLPLDSNSSFTDSASRNDNIIYFVYTDNNILQITEKQVQLEFPPPSTVIKNLFNGDNSKTEYLIISSTEFLSAADSLCIFRNSTERSLNLQTSLVRVEDIYRQYSSGRVSPPAIRDFIRWVYHDWGTTVLPGNTLKYVLLFGDGHYNYRLDEGNFIPPYEEGNMSTDDFFGYLDSNDQIHISAGLDVAIGRVPVNSQSQSMDFYKKVKSYENPVHSGSWRNRILSTADDNSQGNDFDGIRHTEQAEAVLGKALNTEPGKILEQIYLINYEHNLAKDKPDAAQDLLNKINKGVLSVNYMGHGSPDVWADEHLLVVKQAIHKMNNINKNTLITSFSCTVGRFDLIGTQGLSESFLKTPEIGAIATISATRESYANKNRDLAEGFYGRIFLIDSNNRSKTIGDALLEAKNQVYHQINNEKYGLFGEPVLQLRKPNLDIKVNNVFDTIQSLDCGKIEGEIKGGSGQGNINLQIIGQSANKTINVGQKVTQSFNKSGPVLFSTTASYKDYKFSLNYLIPERIPQGDTNALIKAFAWDSKEEREGSILIGNIPVLGRAGTCKITDINGPDIMVTGCDPNQTGSLDFPDKVELPIPYCLEIIIIDSLSGVFISDRPDEGTTVEIIGVQGPVQPQLRDDEFIRKTFKWEINENSDEGEYLLKIKAFDGFGNMSARSLRLSMAKDTLLQVVRVFNVPNPLKGRGTCFYFGSITNEQSSNSYEEGGKYKAEIKIYNQAGTMVKIMKDVGVGQSDEDEATCDNRGAWWTGHDHWGNLLGNGVFFYKVKVKRITQGQNSAKAQMSSSLRNMLVISR